MPALARDVRRVFTQLMRRGVPLAEVEARLAARGRMPNMVEMVRGSRPARRAARWPRTSSRSTSTPSRAPDSPAASTGTATSTATGRRRRSSTGRASRCRRSWWSPSGTPALPSRAGRADARTGGRPRDGHDPALRPLDAAGASRRAEPHPGRLAPAAGGLELRRSGGALRYAGPRAYRPSSCSVRHG